MRKEIQLPNTLRVSSVILSCVASEVFCARHRQLCEPLAVARVRSAWLVCEATWHLLVFASTSLFVSMLLSHTVRSCRGQVRSCVCDVRECQGRCKRNVVGQSGRSWQPFRAPSGLGVSDRQEHQRLWRRRRRASLDCETIETGKTKARQWWRHVNLGATVCRRACLGCMRNPPLTAPFVPSPSARCDSPFMCRVTTPLWDW
jgi:hypothetical protein